MGPRIPAEVAERLASRSDKLASLLESGDSCEAREEAAALRTDVIETINQREIPQLYLEDLLGTVHEIEAQIPACEEAPFADDDGKEPHEKEEGKGKGKGKEEHDKQDEKKHEDDD